jgi:hypothetical protein
MKLRREADAFTFVTSDDSPIAGSAVDSYNDAP